MKQTKPPWLPWPPPNPDWSDVVKRIYERGCKRINELRKQINEDGVCPVPFQCYLCDTMKSNFSMLTGDGVPLCSDCVKVPRPDEM